MEDSKQKETNNLVVDVAELYRELKQKHGEMSLKKTSFVKMRFSHAGETLEVERENTTTGELDAGEIIAINVDENNDAHGGSEYSFGDKKVSQQERTRAFFAKYELVPEKKGFYREKKAVERNGVYVDHTVKIPVAWAPDKPAELRAGGYLVMNSETDFSPINPEDLWAYDIKPLSSVMPQQDKRE